MPMPCEKAKEIDHLNELVEQIGARIHDGDLIFQDIKKDLRTIMAGQDKQRAAMHTFNKRMFIDNGTTSFQTIIDRHDRLLKGALWGIGIISSTMIAFFVTQVIQHVVG